MSDIPYHLSEKQFRKFEHVIAKAVAVYPLTLPLDPTTSSYSPNTYAARLRDAIASLRDNCWATDYVDFKKFLQCGKDLVVSRKLSPMRIGSRAELAKEEKFEAIPPTTDYKIEPLGGMFIKPIDIGRVVCHLAANRLLTQPIPILQLAADDVEWLQDNYDVTITKQTNDIYLIQ